MISRLANTDLHQVLRLRWPSLWRYPLIYSIVLFLSDFTPLWAQPSFLEDVIVKELEMRRTVKALTLDGEGFLWIGTDAGLYRYDGYDFDLVGGETMPQLPLPPTSISSLIQDKQGNIWLATRSEIFIINKDRSKVYRTSGRFEDRIDKEITSILEVEDEIWVADLSSGISCFKSGLPSSDQLTLYRQILLPGHALRFLFRLGDGNILVSSSQHVYFVLSPAGDVLSTFESPIEFPAFYADTQSGVTYLLAESHLYRLNPYQNIVTLETPLTNVVLKHSPTWFIPAQYDDESGYWMGNREGEVLWYSPKTKEISDITRLLDDRVYAGRFFSTYTGIADGADGFWIGTNQGLIHVQLPEKQNFQRLPIPKKEERQNFSVRGMIRAEDQSLFVGSYSGLFRYFPDGSIREYRIWNAEAKRFVNPLAYDFLSFDNNLWIATEGNGLLGFDFISDSLFRVIPETFIQNLAEGEREVMWNFRIFRDRTGIIWLGTVNGLNTIDLSGIPQRFKTTSGDNPEMYKVFDIRETDNGILWIAATSGLYQISADRQHISKTQLPEEIRSEITCITPYTKDKLAVGTRQSGILLYDYSNGQVVHYTVAQGLADNSICAIQSSDNDILWIATNRGLSRLHLSARRFNNYYIEDGLPENEFNHGSWLRDRDGTLYFGGVGGVIRVNVPEGAHEGSSTQIRVSKISYHDGKAGRTKYMTLLPGEIPSINLGSRDKYFTVHYSTTSSVPNTTLSYAYMLENLHSDWQMNDTKNFIQFTGLQAGHYTLKIRFVESTLQDEALLQIPVYVARPFYQQWWAYLLYIMIIGGASFLIFRTYFQQKHIARRLQLESDHRLKLEEINKSKSTFFTNITHEFKTPLTLIQGPAEEIARISKDNRISKHAHLISKNAQSMLSLVNQLLELGKLDAKLEQPHFYRLDLIRHIKVWLGNFESAAIQKDISLTLQAEASSLYADFDPVKIETAVNNLLSNAIKFTPSGGHVTCTVRAVDMEAKTDQVRIIIEDDGSGITPEEQLHVFERFYQGKDSKFGGTGIGLAYAQEMVHIHKGTIHVDSPRDGGARFTITIPTFQQGSLEKKPEMQDDISSDMLPSQSIQTKNVFSQNERLVMLVAEDNIDVSQLIMEVFSNEFQVVLTQNGRDAHLKAMEIVPDIIITDVMMPVMDGLTLTHQLKKDKHTSHIPVVMLTARDGVSARIEGRSQGADAYLNKPFSVSELKLTVRNLLHLRDQVMQHVSQQVEKDVSGVQFANEQDSTFYQSFLNILESNLSEPALSVQDFIRELGVSRTQLHRKMKALTGHSVNHLVRNMRLQRGLALLKHSGKTISEIAYEVGFSSPSYFTERFREYYGYPPSEVLNQEATGPRSGS